MSTPVKSPEADDKGTEVAPGATETSPSAVRQEVRSDASVVPGETEEAARTAAPKSAMKRTTSKVKRGDHRPETNDAAEPTKSLQVTHTKNEEGPEAASSSTRTKKHHRSKLAKSSKGVKKEGDKSPEASDKKDPSPRRDDVAAKDNVPEASAAESSALVEVPAEAPNTALVEAPAFGVPAVSAPDVGAPTVEAPVKARETSAVPAKKMETGERSSRRKSKVAIADDTEDASQGSRRRARQPSQYSRKDSMASTRRMDSSWRSVASTATVKIIHRAFHPLDERERSVFDAEEERVLAAVGCAFLLAFIAIFAGIAYFVVHGRGSAGRVTCDTPECLRARRHMAGLLSLGGDTCSGFYHYVCGSWSGGNSSFAQEVSDALALRLHRGLLEAGNASDRHGRHVAVETYKACHRSVSSSTGSALLTA